MARLLRKVTTKLTFSFINIHNRSIIVPPEAFRKQVFGRRSEPTGEALLPLEERLKDDTDNRPTAIAQPESAVNIGFEPKRLFNSRRERIKMQVKESDTDLEQKARHRQLVVPIDEVYKFWFYENGWHHIRAVAEHYGIYRDLFNDEAYFKPVVDLQVAYDYSEDLVSPVFRGNFIPAEDAQSEPEVYYEANEDSLWTLILTNPDGHLTDNKAEYLHWAVGNIPGNEIGKGQTLINYLQPFPPRGTGAHRYIFVLFKQEKQLDYSSIHRPENCTSLKERTFSTLEFYKMYEDDLRPCGLAFFQSEWDKSVRKVYHDVLDMREPAFEFIHPEPYHPNQVKYPKKQPFDRYFDRYRDKKDLAEEVLKIKLGKISPFEEYIPEKYPLIHRPKYYRPSWLKKRQELMARKLEQFKDLP